MNSLLFQWPAIVPHLAPNNPSAGKEIIAMKPFGALSLRRTEFQGTWTMGLAFLKEMEISLTPLTKARETRPSMIRNPRLFGFIFIHDSCVT